MALRFDLSYAATMAPLALLHLAVPPLDRHGRGWSRLHPWVRNIIRAIQLPIARADLERHFVHTEAAAASGRAYTLVTHMLLHGDYDHLAANLEVRRRSASERETAFCF